jgi:hypothetical protein
MSQISKAVLGIIAVSLTLGAVQFASGHDLADRWQAVAEPQTTGVADPQAMGIANTINRASKADRANVVDRASTVAGSNEETQTISLRPESLSDTTVLVRMPVAKKPETDARNGRTAPSPSPSLFKSGDRRKTTVACEPMVSVLTEVAKQLQPGRCVT